MAIGFLVVSVLAWPRLSYADWDHHGDHHHFYRYHDHPRFGIRVSLLPSGSFSFSLGSARYSYYDGLYYHHVGRDYVLVTPPVGAVVRTIPTDFQPVVINGVTYYVNSGTYYVYTPAGYQVVPQPVVVSQPVTVSPAVGPVTAAGQTETEGTYTVNIPNPHGGYTPVVIKSAKNGFIGPQGEFYPTFPKVSQLEVMYGK